MILIIHLESQAHEVSMNVLIIGGEKGKSENR